MQLLKLGPTVTTARPVGAATRMLRLDGPFRMRRGGALPYVDMAFETWGELSPARDNAVLLLTGLSPKAHAKSSAEDPSPGWWEEMIGPGNPIDTDRFFVVCVNNLGSCFGSTGPASPNPVSGRAYGLDFPTLTIEDMAAAARGVVQRMGIHRLRAVIGPSLGGMTALAYAVQYPDEVANLVSISSAARVSARAIAVHSLQREAIRCDPAWRDGAYSLENPPVDGMRLARKIGMTSYRSAREWEGRFGRERTELWEDEPFGIEFEVESYLEAHARKFVDAFDANCYLYLSRAMDLFDVAEHGGGLDAGLKRVRAERTLVVGVETDTLFPPHQQRELAVGLRAVGRTVHHVELPSIQGHDAFLVDLDHFGPVIAEFMGAI